MEQRETEFSEVLGGPEILGKINDAVGWIHADNSDALNPSMTIALDSHCMEVYENLPEDEQGPYAAKIITETAERKIQSLGKDGNGTLASLELPHNFPTVTDGASPALDFVAALMNRQQDQKNIGIVEQVVAREAQAARQRKPVEGPFGVHSRIAERLRRNDLYESEDGISRWWDSKQNELRTFHVLPEQRFDLDFASELLQGHAPFDFKRLMFPFEEFGITCDGDWIEAEHSCVTDNCNHPVNFREEEKLSLYKPCGYIVRGSYETGKWKLYEKYIARNAERDLHLYTAASIDQTNGTAMVSYNHQGELGLVHGIDNRSRIEKLCNQTIKFVVNFVLVLNHRAVKVTSYEEGKEPGRPQTRQQRRAVGYKDLMPDGEKRDHYKIYIPAVPQAKIYANEVGAGVNAKERRPHDVRGHLRTDKYGRKRIRVAPHKRCKNSTKPYFMADYDAANVGME